VKGHPLTTLEFITQKLKELPVWLIVTLHFVTVLLVVVMLQTMHDYFRE
jgi:hypothetical protein